MKKFLLKIILYSLFLTGPFSLHLTAQKIAYSDTFVNGVAYAPGSAQYDHWGDFVSTLDTQKIKLKKLTVKGTFNQSGRSCTEVHKLRRLAAALKTGSNESLTCDGLTWQVGNCGDGPELVVDGSACNCNAGWSVRPMIGLGNSNWGGVSSNTCNGPNQRMTVVFERETKDNNLAVSSFIHPDLCNNIQPLTAFVSNYGANSVKNFELNWSVNGVIQKALQVTGELQSDKDTEILLTKSFTFLENTNYDIRIWTSNPNGLTDSISDNDTFVSIFVFLGVPPEPTVNSFIQCGNGKPLLQSLMFKPVDEVLWYDDMKSDSAVARGNPTFGPYITGTKTFYAQTFRFGETVPIGLGFRGNNIVSGNNSNFNGAMVDVRVKNTTILDSVTFKLNNNNPGTNYKLFYKPGTHVGNETKENKWILLSQGQVRFFSVNKQSFARVPANELLLEQGKIYGLYYTTDPGKGGGNDIMINLGGKEVSNNYVSLKGNVMIDGYFGSGSVNTNFAGNVELMLREQCNNPVRKPLTVTVKTKPIGADIKKGSIFNGQYKTGVISDPDITEAGKTIEYEIKAPDAYSNISHGTDWMINTIEIKTQYGAVVPKSDYTVLFPGSAGPGRITYTPQSSLVDSFLVVYIRFQTIDFNPCDSVIQRVLVVAPSPELKLNFPNSLCLGNVADFNHTSTIHSGHLEYKWYFGDNDSSDFVNPQHIYALTGNYQLKLQAKSWPWGVLKDTTITMVVKESPKADFNVQNRCEGNALTFTNASSIGIGTLTHMWDFGDNSATSTQANPNHQYTKAGLYPVRLTIKSGSTGCVASAVRNAYQFERPKADMNFSTKSASLCVGNEIAFKNTSTINVGNLSSQWFFGDGKTAVANDFDYTYQKSGTYTVKLLTYSEFACVDSISKVLSVFSTSVPDFTVNKLCEYSGSSFVNKTLESAPNIVYSWLFDDGVTSNQKNLSRSWPASGKYHVTLKAQDFKGCIGVLEKDLDILPQPKAKFTVNTICSGEQAVFVNLTNTIDNKTKYKWNFGNGDTSNSVNPLVNYSPATTSTYTVALYASLAGACADTFSTNLLVNETPNCGFTYKDMGLLQVSFEPSGTGNGNYQWYFGEGGSSTDEKPTYQYGVKNTYKVKLKITNAAGCSCENTQMINASTSVNNFNANQLFQIFPNPSNGLLTVVNATQMEMNVAVYDVSGHQVFATNSTEKETKLDLQDLADGIYLLRVNANGQVFTTNIYIVH